jgi:uncharacterized membrane protein YfcA
LIDKEDVNQGTVRLGHLGYRMGEPDEFALPALNHVLGGVVGAQIGARLVEHVSTDQFRRIFAVVLVGLAGYLFFKR